MGSDDSNLGFAFPRLYRQWVNHDLKYHEDIGSIRPWFYESLKPEDEPRVWRFIEENYLLKYDDFMAVIGGTGIPPTCGRYLFLALPWTLPTSASKA